MAKKTINDPVFGDLEYNEKKGYWTKKILLGMWRGSNFELDLMVKCSKEEEITDTQRDAYNTYLTRRKRLENEIPAALLSYYKDHFEDIERVRNIDEELKIDTVDEKVMLKGLGIKSLFIDRNGNYGWLINFIWKDNPFSVILSDDKIRIYERWGVLVDNYTKVNDKVFGEMVYDRFTWKKLVKKDLFGVYWWLPKIKEFPIVFYTENQLLTKSCPKVGSSRGTKMGQNLLKTYLAIFFHDVHVIKDLCVSFAKVHNYCETNEGIPLNLSFAVHFSSTCTDNGIFG